MCISWINIILIYQVVFKFKSLKQDVQMIKMILFQRILFRVIFCFSFICYWVLFLLLKIIYIIKYVLVDGYLFLIEENFGC